MILEKKLPNGDAIRVKVEAKEYFSITALMGMKKKRYDAPIIILGQKYEIYAGGCLHEEVAEAFPELEKFIPLHISNLDGVPMHVFEDAKYWAKDKSPNILAKHLRIDRERAEAICQADEEAAIFMIVETILEMKPVWKQQAEEFLSFINTNAALSATGKNYEKC